MPKLKIHNTDFDTFRPESRRVLRWLAPVVIGAVFALSTVVLIFLSGGPKLSNPRITGMPDIIKTQQVGTAAVAPGSEVEQNVGPDPLAVDLEQRLAEDVMPLVKKYCFECHGDGKKKAGVNFDNQVTIQQVLDLAFDWEAAVHVLNDRLMPPEDKPQPTQHEILTIHQWLNDALEYYPADAEPDPGWFTIHRLNRAEYQNTLRDLLGIDPTKHDLTADLPPDNTGYGFDNNADVLSMSPLQLEKYLDAAERAIGIALGPMEVSEIKPRPVRRLTLHAVGAQLDSGGQMMWANGDISAQYDFPRPGRYEIQVRAWETPAGDERSQLRMMLGKNEMGTLHVSAAKEAPDTYRVQVDVDKPGKHRIVASYINDIIIDGQDRNVAIENISVLGPLDEQGRKSEVYDQIFFVQPTSDDRGNRLPNAEGRRRVTESQAARNVIEAFAYRAFRRPVRGSEIVPLVQLYRDAREAGDTYEQAVKLSLTATLVSPNFLYRSLDLPLDLAPKGVYELGQFELASRLSYFLWSSMPDQRLMDLAERKQLGDDKTLRAEVRRMIADPKADALVENFAGQWLLLRNLGEDTINRERYPEYTPALRSAMRREVELFFRDVIEKDLAITGFLSSDYTFLNQTLAEHYGIEGVHGENFRRVPLPADSPRGGVLTMAATLTVTSHQTRTSPVLRGQYVLDQLLGTAPPPPPPDIPPLEQAEAKLGKNATLREQLAAHVADPNCAVCHKRLDPIGLAMENFSPTGQWRDKEGGQLIDATGVLPSGEAFDGPTELKKILLDRRDLFVENLTKKMLTYALGRGIEPFDRPAINRLTGQVQENDYRMSALIEAIVLSESFRKCRGREDSE